MTSAPTRFTAPFVLPCDDACSVLRDAVVDVEDGRIAFVGPESQAPEFHGTPTVLSGILLPGLINTHAHTAMTVLRGVGGDLPLMRWLTEAIWPAEARLGVADIRAGTVAGCVEMLQRGITTSVEMYFHSRTVADAVLATGARAVITPGIISVPGWDRLGTWQQMLAGISEWIDADGLRFGPGERIELGYGPHSTYTLPAEAVAAAGEAARERGALLHIHLAESPGEDEAVRAAHGSAPALLEKLGVFADGARVLAAHSVQLSDADIALYARYRVAVAHCPGSNAKLASGTARLLDLQAAGVSVGLGTDGPASQDALDLWDDMRLAARLARLNAVDASALTAARGLLLATRGGAAAIGRDDLGGLAPGARADLIHVELDQPAFPLGDETPDGQLLANLVWGGGHRTVRDVWVAGDRVVTEGRSILVDRSEMLADLRSSARRVASTD